MKGSRISALVLLATIGRAESQGTTFVVNPSDFVMPPEAASKFSDEILSPLLYEFASGTEEPEPLRTRIRKFLSMIETGELYFSPVPAHFPDRKSRILAKLDQYRSKPVILLFIPEVLSWQMTMSKSDFKYGLLVTVAHEMIHLEMRHHEHQGEEGEAARDEAAAWGRTVLEIIRPLQARGVAGLTYYRELSTRLRAFNDNLLDPRWLKTFAQ